jgi:superfamily I DNA/RNA helicase
VLIDEGHDFRPEWFKLITQMVAPQTNSLLVLYDDAQSIYGQNRKRNFSFKSVGIQAQGRTTILKVNYRNTKEILDFTTQFVNRILTQEEADEDGIPQLAPVSAGRHGSKPLVIKLPSLSEEALFIAEKLQEARRGGMAWNEMAVLYRDAKSRNALFKALCAAKIPFEGKDKVKFDKHQERVKFLTFHSSKGLEFPFVAIHGGHIIENLKDAEEEEARLLYVAMTRATSQLVMTVAR